MKAFLKLANHIARKWWTKKAIVWQILLLIKLCDFKMDLIQWQVIFRLCNFGLKSCLWFQIELTLRACSILKSCEWYLTKLHSTLTHFNYHYYPGSEPGFSFRPFFCVQSQIAIWSLQRMRHWCMLTANRSCRREKLPARIPWFLGRWNHIQTNTPLAVDQH